MNEKKTLAALLRDHAVYEDAGAANPDPLWKDALLADLDLEAAIPPAPRPAEPESAPLTLRHLGLMAPAGAVLFLAGYWLGSDGATLTDLSRIHPAVWIAAALGIATATLSYRGLSLFRR